MMCSTSAAGKTINRLEEEEDATIEEHTVDNVGEEEATQDEKEEWVSAGIDPTSGKEYYHNRNTVVLVELVDDEVEEEQTMEEWIEDIDAASGKVYYYNSNSGVMSWTKPVVDGVATLVVKVEHDQAEVVTQADEELLIMEDVEADYEHHQTESKGGAADDAAESVAPSPAAAAAAVDEVVDDATATAAKVADAAPIGAPAAALQDEVDNEADKEANDGQEVVTNEVVVDITTEPAIDTIVDNVEEDETWVSASIDPTSGKEYYYNPHTGGVKIVDDDEVEEEQSMEEWIEDIDAASGKVYYYNLNTGVTSWTKPVLDGVAHTSSKSKVKSVEQVEDELPMEDNGEDEQQTKLQGHYVVTEVDIDNVVAALLQDDDLLCEFLGLATRRETALAVKKKSAADKSARPRPCPGASV